MTYVFETTIADKAVVVEYVLSSVNGLIKVVDMTVDGKFHRMNWMSKEGQASLMEDLENDMTNRMCGTSGPTEEDYLIGKMELHYGI